MTDLEVCRKIRRIRLNKGYRQVEAAAMLHYSRSNYSVKEQGKSSFSIKDLLALSEGFQVPVSDSFTPDENKMARQRCGRPRKII